MTVAEFYRTTEIDGRAYLQGSSVRRPMSWISEVISHRNGTVEYCVCHSWGRGIARIDGIMAFDAVAPIVARYGIWCRYDNEDGVILSSREAVTLAIDSRDVLTINAAAAACGVSRRTIYNWIGKGKVSYVRTAGGRIRIFEDTLWQRREAAPAAVVAEVRL